MRIAISTNSLSADTSVALQRAAALGATWVEINLQSAEFYSADSDEHNARFYRELRPQLEALNLAVWSVTTTPLLDVQQTPLQTRKETLLNVARAAGALGAAVVVTESSNLFSNAAAMEPYFAGETAPPVIDGYDDVWVQITNRRMKLALRNGEFSVQRMAKITRDLAIHCALDLHYAGSDAPIDVWADVLGERLVVAYSTENDTAGHVAELADVAGCLVLHGARDDSAETWRVRLEQTTKAYG
ncbi:MAG: hypothetical protein M9965_03940 [Anaerolineae bacterium]|nr:hypothetical protein [Anaerolineae bacterium]